MDHKNLNSVEHVCSDVEEITICGTVFSLMQQALMSAYAALVDVQLNHDECNMGLVDDAVAKLSSFAFIPFDEFMIEVIAGGESDQQSA